MHNQVPFATQSVTPTNHALVRKQQRCIPDFIRDLLLDFGLISPAGKGAERYTFGKKSWRDAEAHLGPLAKHCTKYRNVFVVMTTDGVVITEGWVH